MVRFFFEDPAALHWKPSACCGPLDTPSCERTPAWRWAAKYAEDLVIIEWSNLAEDPACLQAEASACLTCSIFGW